MRRIGIIGTALLGLTAGLAAASIAPQSAEARSYKVLYSFCPLAPNCADGAFPRTGLIMDGAGALYGTTINGGANNRGTVFKLAPNAAKTMWTETVLHSFCARSDSINCTDGSIPFSTLLRDSAGNLFGTTASGGRFCASHGFSGCGTAFGLLFNKTTRTYTHKLIHAFCVNGGCTDGSSPYAGFIKDGAGNLFGTTAGGNTNGDYGNVIKLTPDATKTRWTRKVLYRFCSLGHCADGETPYASLIMDSKGNLYGVTWDGGRYDGGVVFQLVFNKAANRYTRKVIHSFCAKANCADGTNPDDSLIMDRAGNIFGTTNWGGRYPGNGSVFQLVPNAAKTAWTHKVIYNFCAKTRCADGTKPSTSLVMDRTGKLFGMTIRGGAKGKGTIFQLTPNAAKTKWTQKVLYSFCRLANCVDGSAPDAGSGGLMMDSTGNIFGTTSEGGTTGKGTVFRLSN